MEQDEVRSSENSAKTDVWGMPTLKQQSQTSQQWRLGSRGVTEGGAGAKDTLLGVGGAASEDLGRGEVEDEDEK